MNIVTARFKILIQLWDKWPKCVAKNDRNVSAKTKPRCKVMVYTINSNKLVKLY